MGLLKAHLGSPSTCGGLLLTYLERCYVWAFSGRVQQAGDRDATVFQEAFGAGVQGAVTKPHEPVHLYISTVEK